MSEEPKKKRRQNVACSCCKLRRIKCDLQEILTALPSSSSSSPPPLNVLVEQNPDIECSNCIKKGLKCDTQGIREPTKPNKGGKRIDEARKVYGGQDPRGSSYRVDDNPLELFSNIPSCPPESLPLTSSHAFPDATAPLFDASGLLNLPAPPEDMVNNDPPTSNVPALTSGETLGTFQEAASIWRQFADHRQEAINHVQTTGQTPRAHLAQLPESDHIWDQNLQNRVSSELAQMQRLAEASDKGFSSASQSTIDLPDPFNARSNLPILQSSIPSPIPSPYSFDHISNNQLTPLSGYNDYITNGYSRKRSRSPYEEEQFDSHKLLAQNPWRLWSENQNHREMVNWGRREAVSEQLADRALGMALSNHLVKTFFQAVHLSFPAISPEAFYLEWAKAGQRSDRMTPAQEALCAVIEAWGARYSDSPVVRLPRIGGSADPAIKVIKPDGTFAPGTRARAHWGRARITACKGLMKRAKRLIDENGLFTNPSITGVQALTLYNQAMHMTDQQVIEKDHWLQSRMIHSIITEQMHLLGLIFSQLQMKQRRLFWTHMVSDAFFAASIGQLPKIPQEDVDSAGEWIETVQERLPNSSFKLLAFFLQMNHRLGLAGREVATRIAYPSRRKGAADVEKLCSASRKIWRDLKSISKDLNTKVTLYLESCRKDDLLGFSPLNFHANLRLCCPFLLLVMHQLIRDLLDFWKTMPVATASIATPSDNTSYSSPSSASSGQQRPFVPGMRNIELLERLSRESIDGLLANCRSQIGMLQSILPTGVIQSGSILLRVLMSMAQLLSEVPTNEQGYPSNTPGGYGWTWETKQQSVNICLEALHQIVSISWADVGPICDSVGLTMERMTPSPDELLAWQTNNLPTPPSADIIRAKEEEQKASEEAVKSVLVFWPTASVPQLIENAMQKDPKAILHGLMDMGRQTPPNSQYQSSQSFKPPATSLSEHDPLRPIPTQVHNDPTRSIIGNLVGAVGDKIMGDHGQSIIDSSYQLPENQRPTVSDPFEMSGFASTTQTQNIPEPQYDDSTNLANLQTFLNQKSDRFMEFYQFPANDPHVSLEMDSNALPVAPEQTFDQLDVEAFLNELGLPQEPIVPVDPPGERQ
uniref:Zn(2)-C6 fungal-type domain-containing protein n=1 Tax=Kwoniella pini CBS 10737 TaxID=1296096 RepID=A0A1B9IE90_9TREE|nr:uncharacterized protein I206_01202 [Kwoniella pini CBS 10737]OCF53895.1 hypothetical protein I206_01202 [Kwoniella pini CBS 10737]